MLIRPKRRRDSAGDNHTVLSLSHRVRCAGVVWTFMIIHSCMHHHSLSVVDQGKNKANIMQYIQGIQSTSMKYAGSARCIRDKYNAPLVSLNSSLNYCSIKHKSSLNLHYQSTCPLLSPLLDLILDPPLLPHIGCSSLCGGHAYGNGAKPCVLI